jgi:hypothetical protein
MSWQRWVQIAEGKPHLPVFRSMLAVQAHAGPFH